MPGKGRPQKSAEQKLLEGNRGRRAIGKVCDTAPVVSDIEISPPSYLKGSAKKLWQATAPTLISQGVIKITDISAFAAYCVVCSRFQQAEKELSKTGLTILDADGVPKANPLVGISQKYLQEMKELSREFGLTPSARAAIMATLSNISDGTKKAQSPLEAILSSTFDDDSSNFDLESNFS